MWSRHRAVSRLRLTGRPRRALGTILVLSGMLLWVIATLSLISVEASLGVISGGTLVVGGIVLIALPSDQA
jgi:hypothetical protein